MVGDGALCAQRLVQILVTTPSLSGLAGPRSFLFEANNEPSVVNVSSASLTSSYPTALPTVTSNTQASTSSASSASAVASLISRNLTSSSTSSASTPSSGSNPAQDAKMELKSLSKELLAVMLIQDPVQRAKAAADLYKQ